jgi:hypothetical protein
MIRNAEMRRPGRRPPNISRHENVIRVERFWEAASPAAPEEDCMGLTILALTAVMIAEVAGILWSFGVL